VHVTANGLYEPKNLVLKADTPTRLEVDVKLATGCTNAMISPFWEGRLPLVNDEIAVKEFVTPKEPGRYKITCWMGMVAISVEVI
jgi:plastocyanin domain-containing protein